MNRPTQAVAGVAVVALTAISFTGSSSGRALSGAAFSGPSALRAAHFHTADDLEAAKPASDAPPPKVLPRVTSTALIPYGDCQQLLTQVKKEATAEVGPYGIAGSPYGGPPGVVFAGGGPAMATGSSTAGASAGTAAMAPAPSGAGTFSGTNNQEAGVDEPDMVKTDGRLMVVMRQQQALEVIDLSGAKPALVATVVLKKIYSAQVFLVGSNAVVIGTADDSQSTRVQVLSLTDPHHPTLLRTITAPGAQVASRLIDGHVVLVLQQSPQLKWVYPADASHAGTVAATRKNKAIISRSTLADWMPSVRTLPTNTTWPTDCSSALHPRTDSGVSRVTVLSFDPASSEPGKQATTFGNASTVYANTTSMYLATTSWADQMLMVTGKPVRIKTEIHKFDLSDPASPRYVASGVALGSLTDQYALSELNGDLRVATTVGPATPPPNEGATPASASDNRVTVLRASGPALVPVGLVTGMGRGEKIYGVRFVGALGYVVTFRQTDPLYVIDFSNPLHPVVKGSLELTGYSGYLHPVGDGLLFGIGQEVDPKSARPEGTQVSVFDVSNPAQPLLRARNLMPDSSSPAESDPHAFLWWAPKRLVVVPLSSYTSPSQSGSAVVLRVDSAGHIAELGRINHPQPDNHDQTAGRGSTSGGAMVACCWMNPQIQRTLVIDKMIYTVSDRGVMTSDIDTLDDGAWVPFA